MDLEEAEDPIPPDLMQRIKRYGRLGSAERIVEDPKSPYFVLWSIGGLFNRLFSRTRLVTMLDQRRHALDNL